MWSWPMVCSAQLGEWSLPTPEDPGWNPDMVNFIEQILTVDKQRDMEWNDLVGKREREVKRKLSACV